MFVMRCDLIDLLTQAGLECPSVVPATGQAEAVTARLVASAVPVWLKAWRNPREPALQPMLEGLS